MNDDAQTTNPAPEAPQKDLITMKVKDHLVERIDRVVFYYVIECANCRNEAKVSHQVIENTSGELVCSLCGKIIRVVNWENMVEASKVMNAYLSDGLNAQFIRLELNPKYELEEEDLGH